MARRPLEPAEVFPSVGKPTITYVERDNGNNEKRLKQGLLNKGQICLLTGPSKTGKTCLYKTVLPAIRKQELVIRCSGDLKSSDFWASALESLNFERLAERVEGWGLDVKGTIGVKGEAGWPWLAKLVAGITLSAGANTNQSYKKEIIKAGISSKQLIPLLKELPIQLVVEDFHYLQDDVQREVFQQWKSFIDEGVSVVVVSTTHHAVDIAKANPDLSGRVRLIDIGKWEQSDLAQIPEKGFKYFEIKASTGCNDRIARESVGLPIIAQQLSQEIASKRDFTPGSKDRLKNVTENEIKDALSTVADELYANHKGDYERLSTGPRKRARKHASYERILASFALEPLRFSLKFHELMERVNKLSPQGADPIPTASITAALKALGSFQSRNKISLLEWHAVDNSLYIIEPSFLFYLRQKLHISKSNKSAEEILRMFIERVWNQTIINGQNEQIELGFK